MKLTKSFDLADYDELIEEVASIDESLDRLNGQYDMQHKHRRWEYGMALKSISMIGGVKTILDVGSGKSPFPAILAMLGYDVEAADLGPRPTFYDKWPVNIKWANLKEWLPSKDGYDVVTCISVIEHVENDKEKLEWWWCWANKGMILTYDCTEEGVKLVPWHLRTYSPLQMANMMKSLPGAKLFGGIDPVYHGRLVHAGGVPGSFGSCTVVRDES